MAGSVKVNTQKLRETADKFTNSRAQIKSTTDAMTSTAHEVASIWKGETSSKYAQKFSGLQDEMQTIYKMVTEHIDDLQQMATEFEDADKAAADATSKLKTDLF